MKLTIFQEREFDFVGKDGKNVIGKMFAGFKPDGSAIEFSAKKDRVLEIHNVSGYDEKLAIDINVLAKIFQGKVSFREEVRGETETT
jgi:hypothetical protein